MTRRLLERLTAWSPVLLLAGLAALTYWLDAQVRAPGPAREKPARDTPDMFIENFRAVNFGADGRVHQSLSAKRAEHFPADGSATFVDPRLEMDEPGKPRVVVTAERGRLEGDRDRATFTGQVRAIRDVPPEGGPEGAPPGRTTLTTEELVASLKDERFTSSLAVTIEDPRGIIRGTGLEFDNRAKSALLKSQVSGSFAPRPSTDKK
jgi:lipopolysaccharide export system protein LptC